MCQKNHRANICLILSLALAGMIATAPAAGQSRIEDLNWLDESGTYILRNSHGTVRIGGGTTLLLGDDARRGTQLMEGIDSPQTEAILYNYNDDVAVIFEYYPSGYVRNEDWATVDPDRIMSEIVEGTDQANRERKRRGYRPLRITGWISEPSYNQRNQSVSFALAAESDGEKIVNLSVLKLGRLGYEKITWVGRADQYGWSDRMLYTLVDNHSFDPGYRYADYQEGDKVSSVGLAALVVAIAASKGNRSGLVQLLRKSWLMILAAFGALAAVGRWMFSSQ